jgi:hypothetical protein
MACVAARTLGENVRRAGSPKNFWQRMARKVGIHLREFIRSTKKTLPRVAEEEVVVVLDVISGETVGFFLRLLPGVVSLPRYTANPILAPVPRQRDGS